MINREIEQAIDRLILVMDDADCVDIDEAIEHCKMRQVVRDPRSLGYEVARLLKKLFNKLV